MSRRDNLRTLETADGDSLYASLELDMYDEDVIFEDELDSEMDTQSRRSKKTGRGQEWRRVDQIREDKLLRLALADFDDYDFEYTDSASDSACFH